MRQRQETKHQRREGENLKIGDMDSKTKNSRYQHSGDWNEKAKRKDGKQTEVKKHNAGKQKCDRSKNEITCRKLQAYIYCSGYVF